MVLSPPPSENSLGTQERDPRGNSLTKQIINLIRHLSKLSEHRFLCGLVVIKKQNKNTTVWIQSADLFFLSNLENTGNSITNK